MKKSSPYAIAINLKRREVEDAHDIYLDKRVEYLRVLEISIERVLNGMSESWNRDIVNVKYGDMLEAYIKYLRLKEQLNILIWNDKARNTYE